MKASLTAALVLAGTLGAASAAMAAAPVARHPAHPVAAHKAMPVTVMSEKSNPNPDLTDVFAASDGAFYTPVTHDPRSHGLPQY